MAEPLTADERELLEDLADIYGASPDHQPVILSELFNPQQMERIAAALKKLLPSSQQ